MKKLLAGLLVGALLLGTVGCASKSEPATTPADSSTESSTKQDITLTYMASQDWVTDAELALGEKFTEETGIKVDYQIVPADQYFNLLLTKLNTGECTDLFGSQAGRFDIVSQLNVEKMLRISPVRNGAPVWILWLRRRFR